MAINWQHRNAEMTSVRRHLPDVTISLKDEYVILDGPFPIHNVDTSMFRHYLLKVAFPRDYPKWVPAVFMREPGIYPIAEHHLFLDSRTCLCLPHEIPKYLPGEIRFEPFFNRLLNPWLIGQAYYDEYHCWPWPERSHGKPGILEGFSELLGIVLIYNPLDNPDAVPAKANCNLLLLLKLCHSGAEGTTIHRIVKQDNQLKQSGIERNGAKESNSSGDTIYKKFSED